LATKNYGHSLIDVKFIVHFQQDFNGGGVKGK
jgi:hypothetical protein